MDDVEERSTNIGQVVDKKRLTDEAKIRAAQESYVKSLYARDEVAEDEAELKPHQTHVKDPNAPGGVRRVRFSVAPR
jgi:hypothetical protein